MKQRIEDQPRDCIRTNSGLFINVFNTTPDMICVEDIAHATSFIPRFGGHLNRFYSVAQHCVLAARKAKKKLVKKQALLHDGTEGYLLDMPSPIKARLLEYKQYENKLMEVIFAKFDLPYPMDPEVKKIDKYLLQFEYENLVIRNNKKFECWSPKKAKREFLKTYKELFNTKSIC